MGVGGLVSVVTVMVVVEDILDGFRGQWLGRNRRQNKVQKNVVSTIQEFICL